MQSGRNKRERVSLETFTLAILAAERDLAGRHPARLSLAHAEHLERCLTDAQVSDPNYPELRRRLTDCKRLMAAGQNPLSAIQSRIGHAIARLEQEEPSPLVAELLRLLKGTDRA